MKTHFACITAFLFFALVQPVFLSAQNLTGPQEFSRVTSVIGRLSLEKNHGRHPWLVLLAKNGTSYLIQGKMVDELRALLSRYGANNLVFLTGYVDGRSNISCGQKAVSALDENGKEYKKIDTSCIRYYLFDVQQVIWGEESDEQLAPPARDAEQEKLIKESHSALIKPPPISGEIAGTITALNMRSPIKTVEITDPNPDAQIKKVVLLVKSTTSVTRKNPTGSPMIVAVTALHLGQTVSATYTREENISSALAISILGE